MLTARENIKKKNRNDIFTSNVLVFLTDTKKYIF